MENRVKGTKDVNGIVGVVDIVSITVTVISIIVTVISILQSAMKNRHQKSNRPDQS